MKPRNWIIAVAILAGLFNIAPYIYAYLAIPDVIDINLSQKLHYFYQDSELIYLGRIREVVEGEWGIASLAFWEYKNAPVIQQPFGEWLYAIMSLGKAELLPFIALISKGIFPAALFLLIFSTIRLVLSRENLEDFWVTIIAIVLAWLISSGLDVYRPHHLIESILNHGGGEPILSLWTRVVNPITGMLGLLLTIYMTLNASGRFSYKRGIMWGIVVGISSGYIFSFGMIIAFCGVILFVWCLYKEWDRVRESLVALTTALLINYSFIIGIFSKLNRNGDSLGKNGLFETNLLLINNILLVGVFIFFLSLLYFIFVEKIKVSVLFSRPWWRFCLASLLASKICYTQQLVTGKTVWPQHFVQYTDPVVFIIVVGCALLVFSSVVKKIKFWQSAYTTRMLMGGGLLVISFTIIAQIAALPTVFVYAHSYSDSQRYVSLIDWLKINNKNETCVVFPLETRERIERFIFAYTPCDLYHSSYVYMSVPEERIMHNYISHLRLLGVTPESLDSYLEDNYYEWQHLFFRDWYDKFSEKPDPWLQSIAKPNQKEEFYSLTKDNIKNQYLESLETPLLEWISKYRLDYLVIDHKNDQIELDANLFEALTTVNQITVYRAIVQ